MISRSSWSAVSKGLINSCDLGPLLHDPRSDTRGKYLLLNNALGSSTLSPGPRLLLNPKVHFVPSPFNGDHWFERFGDAHGPTVQWGVGISIGVQFGAGSTSERSMDFAAAGCDFRP